MGGEGEACLGLFEMGNVLEVGVSELEIRRPEGKAGPRRGLFHEEGREGLVGSEKVAS